MTLEEFIIDLHGFGGGHIIEERTEMISAANRALRELYLSIPITKTVRYHVNSRKPVNYHKKILCGPGETVIIPFEGRAYTMRVSGFGNYTIDDGTISVRQYDAGKGTLVLRGFTSGKGTFKFWGNFTTIIYDFTTYDDIFGADVFSIPESSTIQHYDIKSTHSDFLAMVSSPTDMYGNEIKNCRVREGTLEVASDFSGEILLTYRRLPKLIYGIDEDNDDSEDVDVTDDHAHLLLYLTWYHYWYNIDEAKARIYRERCDKMLELINENRRYIDKQYVDVNGWA